MLWDTAERYYSVFSNDGCLWLIIPRMHRTYLQDQSLCTVTKEYQKTSGNWHASSERRELSLEAMTGMTDLRLLSVSSRLSSLRGGAIVYRVALWYPDFVTHIFSVCTPFWVPSKDFKPLEELVKIRLPNFQYQIQLASGDIEKAISTREQIKQFLNGLYGGKGPNGEVGFIPEQGVLLENLPKLRPTRIVSEKVGCPC